MRKVIFLLSLLLMAQAAFSQKKAYVIYNAKGKKVRYKQLTKALLKQDIVLFGEEHDNPIAHWLQYEITTDLQKSRSLILGAEMFEADNQTALNEYIRKQLTPAEFASQARLWPNYPTDYAPLVDFAKENQLPFVATNIPRRYANLVFRKGFEALDSLAMTEKAWMAPLPIPFDSELPTYQNILVELGDHGSPELVKAQAMKDATMAHFILANYQKDHLFLHFNGAYHSDYYEGILWYLKRERAELKYATLSTVSQDRVDKLLESNRGKADFIICIDSDMTKTY